MFVFSFGYLLGQLDTASLAVGEARVHLLAGLLDGLEDGLVVEAWLSDNQSFLLLERNVVVLDAYFYTNLLASHTLSVW